MFELVFLHVWRSIIIALFYCVTLIWYQWHGCSLMIMYTPLFFHGHNKWLTYKFTTATYVIQNHLSWSIQTTSQCVTEFFCLLYEIVNNIYICFSRILSDGVVIFIPIVLWWLLSSNDEWILVDMDCTF